MAGYDEDEDLVDVLEMAETPLPPLKSVFDCPNIELCLLHGKNGWKCLWCDTTFTPVHATRAISHVLKIKKCNIAVCTAMIPNNYFIRYKALHDESKQSKDARKLHNEFVKGYVDNDQSSAVELSWIGGGVLQ